ncbi:unnamed protein product [Diatraea saccharalis]|uniref:PHD-type domain-containing protein n=1 Tax=Diatraea saccharalis TaxID=40085 RepID=A0A9N9R6A3_9NEOP|nr:unnamed protein product [Diatraea saccharalis]
MSLLVTCYHCKNRVEAKKTVVCSMCKNAYEYDCIGYSEKLRFMKDLESRKIWKCKTCEELSKHSVVTTRKKMRNPDMREKESPAMEITVQSTPTNVSQQCHQDSHILTQAELSLEESPSGSDQILLSLDYSVTDTITVQELKENITLLQSELDSSHRELHIRK